MNVIEPLTECPTCWGRGHIALADDERPEDWPCQRCGTSGRVTLAEAHALRAEARAFVEKAIRAAEDLSRP